ncbi:MAG: 5-(carboxyamino)imidazole ribonucleotide mutase [candidate division Zixibacteria bacterium]|nr:5-(carboxyamino)imidazole ribonucleotide mutase [candidate division Zixibacteria bacterium]
MSKVLILIGSKSDNKYADKTSGVLKDFGIEHDVVISSAHRQPEKTQKLTADAESNGYSVIIAMAGYSAALPGVASSHSKLPVIGVPLPTSDLKGVDSILSIAQMPGGVPVASMGIGMAGAKNAAFFALRIIALNDSILHNKLSEFIENQTKG